MTKRPDFEKLRSQWRRLKWLMTFIEREKNKLKRDYSAHADALKNDIERLQYDVNYELMQAYGQTTLTFDQIRLGDRPKTQIEVRQ